MKSMGSGRRFRRGNIRRLCLLRLVSPTRSQLDRTGFAAPLLAVLLECVIYFLSAISGHADQVLAFGEALGREANARPGIISLACLLVEELGGFEIAVPFGHVTAVVQCEGATGIPGVCFEEILP